MTDYDTALPIYEELLAELPDHAQLHLTFANSLKTVGRTAEAISHYRRAAGIKGHFGEACWSLANLKTYEFTAADVQLMQDAEAAADVAPADRYHLCFALGQALEDRRQDARAFTYYRRGNELKRAETRFRRQALEANARQTALLCNADFFASRQGFGSDAVGPIFIVGLPRSGSTLIEQILASHSQIEGTMELAEIPRLAQDLHGSELTGGGPGYPATIANLTAPDCRSLGEAYLHDTRIYRHGRPFFIDKMPNNFLHIGLIRLILPNARIIDARREPMACCFSIYKQLFAAGQRFAYAFEDIAGYYRLYADLMAHWERVLPGRILRIQHEDLVADLAGNVRRMLDFCGLPFEPACLEFHRTRRAVHSASSEQVQQPLTSRGLAQWRHFEPWLGPLRAALGELVSTPN
jgi:tetratricopeptide (TPR) repeat protein